MHGDVPAGNVEHPENIFGAFWTYKGWLQESDLLEIVESD
jgi:hypothetical protein